MQVQELRRRVAADEYVVDPHAVANAIYLKWRALHAAPWLGLAGGSGEVVEAG